MRRKLRNLKNKSGDSQNGAPRALLDLAAYRSQNMSYDSEYAGWAWASRPRDQAISVRRPFGPSLR